MADPGDSDNNFCVLSSDHGAEQATHISPIPFSEGPFPTVRPCQLSEVRRRPSAEQCWDVLILLLGQVRVDTRPS